ncbi:MAG: septum site-determining protein MinC [Xanthomonadales bacterium]|nr:septum site-determining protein MinC [Xanthomonadales bacterium]
MPRWASGRPGKSPCPARVAPASWPASCAATPGSRRPGWRPARPPCRPCPGCATAACPTPTRVGAPRWAADVAAGNDAACDLRVGQVGVATLKLRRLDGAAIAAELRAKVEAAPQLLGRAAVIVDLNAFTGAPSLQQVRELLATVREAGLLPVALTYGAPDIEALARSLDLPLLSRFRANFEPGDAAPAAAAAPPPPASPAPEPARPATAAPAGGIRLHEGHVRSGQQVYARGQDLTVVGSVGAGAEVIADGNIHIYGALRGRALAGAAGDTAARVFCREFSAELVAVAGHYRVLDDAPAALRGKAVQVRLDGERLLFEPL